MICVLANISPVSHLARSLRHVAHRSSSHCHCYPTLLSLITTKTALLFHVHLHLTPALRTLAKETRPCCNGTTRITENYAKKSSVECNRGVSTPSHRPCPVYSNHFASHLPATNTVRDDITSSWLRVREMFVSVCLFLLAIRTFFTSHCRCEYRHSGPSEILLVHLLPVFVSLSRLAIKRISMYS